MRSEFNVAAFQAMKAVEVAVRDASGLPNDLLGTKLMRKAFDSGKGPLTDPLAEDGEKEARSALFAGAIGSYKNPHSHRDVNLPDPAEGSRDHHACKPSATDCRSEKKAYALNL